MMKALCERLKSKEPYRFILTDSYIKELYNTAPLHDIGKVGIPDSILLKPGRLTPEEFEIMKNHVTFGVEALSAGEFNGSSLPFIRTALEIVSAHHEKYDGTGYPKGLAGIDIPLPGRLMAIIDVYDALVSQRVYKAAYSHEEAISIIKKERGRHFDPDITDTFFEIEAEIKSIFKQFVKMYA